MEEALDLSFDRLLMMMMTILGEEYRSVSSSKTLVQHLKSIVLNFSQQCPLVPVHLVEEKMC